MCRARLVPSPELPDWITRFSPDRGKDAIASGATLPALTLRGNRNGDSRGSGEVVQSLLLTAPFPIQHQLLTPTSPQSPATGTGPPGFGDLVSRLEG